MVEGDWAKPWDVPARQRVCAAVVVKPWMRMELLHRHSKAKAPRARHLCRGAGQDGKILELTMTIINVGKSSISDRHVSQINIGPAALALIFQHLGQHDLRPAHLLDDDLQAFDLQHFVLVGNALERFVDQPCQGLGLDVVEVDVKQAFQLE